MARQGNDVARTLDRGLLVLELVADHPSRLSLGEIADLLELHRTVVHRLVPTWPRTGWWPATTTSATCSRPALSGSPRASTRTCVRSGCHCWKTSPTRAGQTHPLSRGSAGLAILMARPPQPGERQVVSDARSVGYVITREEVIPGTWGVSALCTRRADRSQRRRLAVQQRRAHLGRGAGAPDSQQGCRQTSLTPSTVPLGVPYQGPTLASAMRLTHRPVHGFAMDARYSAVRVAPERPSPRSAPNCAPTL